MPDKIAASVQDISKQKFEKAARRLTVVRALLNRGNLIREHPAAAKELGISERHLRSLIRTVKLSSDHSVRSLLPKPRGPSIGKRYLSEAVEAIIDGYFSKPAIGKKRGFIYRVFQAVRTDCRLAGLPLPSYGAVYRRFIALPAEQRIRLTDGAVLAKQITQPVPGAFLVQGAYSLIQIDHTLCDIQIVHRHTRMTIGRPWLSLALDVSSRMVAGFYISLEAPSALSTALCLRACMLPKSEELFGLGFDFYWPCEGLPDAIHSDNGSDFRSENLQRMLTAYDIAHYFRPVGKPNFGGHIERLIGTFMGELHFLPGTTLENSLKLRTRKYDSESAACLTIEEFSAYICAQINAYHNTVHSSIRVPPIVAWMTELSKRSAPLRKVLDPNTLSIDFLPYEKRKVRRDGITFQNIRYWNSELSCLVAEPGRQVRLNYDPRDLSRIYVTLPSGESLEVKFADTSRPPVSLWEVTAAKREIGKTFRGEIHEERIFEMILAKRKIIESAKAKTKAARRAMVKQHERTEHALERAQNQQNLVAPRLVKSSTGATGGKEDPNHSTIYDVEEW